MDKKDALKSLFQIYSNLGFNPREIAHVLHAAITEIELDLML